MLRSSAFSSSVASSHLPSCQECLRVTAVPRKEKGESEGEEKLTNSFTNLERDVGLEVIHYEGVNVEGLRREGVSAAEGGGALEGESSSLVLVN